MKKYLLYGTLAFLLLSCEKEDLEKNTSQKGGLTITEEQIGEISFQSVSGNVTSDITFTADENWILNGAIKVEPGATLTIEKGTNIYGAFGTETSYLSVQQGAKIMANGSSDEPIVFSTIRKLTSIPQPGDWGGLILNGRGIINEPGGVTEGEGGSGLFGGSIENDNSGTLKYVIVEYGGKVLGTDNEMNNISLNGCGSNTIVDNIQALYGNDDGIEIFGGSVNVSHAISLGNGDDSFDWSLGWTGKGQFWVAQQSENAGDKGIEADNNENNYLATPDTDPIVSNVTLIGSNDGDNENEGIELRHGTKGKIYNAIVTNFPRHGVEVKDSSINYIGGDLTLNNSYVFNNGSQNIEGKNFKNSDEFEQDQTNSTEVISNLNGFIGVVENDGFDPSTIDSWFKSTDYIGAVPANDNWTSWANELR